MSEATEQMIRINRTLDPYAPRPYQAPPPLTREQRWQQEVDRAGPNNLLLRLVPLSMGMFPAELEQQGNAAAQRRMLKLPPTQADLEYEAAQARIAEVLTLTVEHIEEIVPGRVAELTRKVQLERASRNNLLRAEAQVRNMSPAAPNELGATNRERWVLRLEDESDEGCRPHVPTMLVPTLNALDWLKTNVPDCAGCPLPGIDARQVGDSLTPDKHGAGVFELLR